MSKTPNFSKFSTSGELYEFPNENNSISKHVREETAVGMSGFKFRQLCPWANEPLDYSSSHFKWNKRSTWLQSTKDGGLGMQLALGKTPADTH